MAQRKMYEETVLGFAEEMEAETNSPENLASKAGGLPIWLYRSPAKPPKVIRCSVCLQAQRFLLQIYCPLEEEVVGHGNAFHRMLYVTICQQANCQRRGGVGVVRAQLSRENEYYGWDGGMCVDDIVGECCVVCGFWGEMKCSGCGTRYCGKLCQSVDWKLGHRECCRGVDEGVEEVGRGLRFAEVEIVTDSHPLPDDCDLEENEEEEEGEEEDGEEEVNSKDCDDDTVEPKIKGSMQDADGDELPEELFRGKGVDKAFSRMQRIVGLAPDQVIRYWRGGSPLWGSTLNQCVDNKVPNCERCGGRRVFEMQIMSQLIYYIAPSSGAHTIGAIAERLRADMDWLTIAVYCCVGSCGDGGEYHQEFAWVQ